MDVKDLPEGYSLGSGEFTVKAPLYSGYKLKVGSTASMTALAQVAYADNGAPVALVGGEMQSLDRPAEAPVQGFTNRNGRFAATGLKPGRYRLTIFTDPVFATEVVVKEGDSTLVNLGDIRITVP